MIRLVAWYLQRSNEIPAAVSSGEKAIGTGSRHYGPFAILVRVALAKLDALSRIHHAAASSNRSVIPNLRVEPLDAVRRRNDFVSESKLSETRTCQA